MKANIRIKKQCCSILEKFVYLLHLLHVSKVQPDQNPQSLIFSPRSIHLSALAVDEPFLLS